MYDAISEGRPLRRNLFIALGTFHIYKQACVELFRMVRSSVIGPLLHALMPGAKVKDFIKLKELTAIFTLLRHAYPHIKRTLIDAQRAVPPDTLERAMLQNLYFLLDFYIPMVRHLPMSHSFSVVVFDCS